MTTTRYVVIDRHSGYIFHVCDAETPEDAALQTQIAVNGDRGWTVQTLDLSDTTTRGYEVHIAPADWQCDDGQDPAALDEVTSWKSFTGRVWIYEAK